MANTFRVIGLVAICAGLVFIVLALVPLAQGQPIALLGSPVVTQAMAAITAGIVALALGQLIAVNHRMAESMASLLAHIKNEDGGSAEEPQAAPARDAFAHVPSYDPRRDPPVVKEGTYRAYTVLTLRDGTIAIETQEGWKRFRTIQDFDRLLRA